MGIVRAPGTVTVGVDRKGKHYKYESGKGRGRQSLNLSHAQAQALTARGLKPGSPIALSASEAMSLGSGGGAKAPGGKSPSKKSLPGMDLSAGGGVAAPNPDSELMGKIGDSHRDWIKSGGGKSIFGRIDRLKDILNDTNIAWLENAGPNPTAAHKTFAGAILATVFGRDMGRRSQADAGTSKEEGKSVLSVKFHPGGNGTNGEISLEGKGGENKGSIAFKSLRDMILDTEGLKQIRDDFTQAKFDETTPEPGSHHEMFTVAAKVIDRSNVTSEHKESYKSGIRHILNRMPQKAADMVKESVKAMSFHDSWDDVTEQVKRLDPSVAKRFGDKVVAHGAFSHKTGLMILDGGDSDGPHAIKGTYAHEIGHAIDSKHKLSKTQAWQTAWNEEAKHVSDYATKTPAEGFAEYARLMYSGDMSRDQAQVHHPKMYKFFEKSGLLPTHFNESNPAGKSPKMDDIFDTPILTDKTTGDGHRVATKPSKSSLNKESKLKKQGKQVTERPSGFQVQDTKGVGRRFEGEVYKTKDDALHQRHSDQAPAVKDFHTEIKSHG